MAFIKAGFAGYFSPRAVLSLPRSPAHEALHHGLYGPEGQLQWYGKAGIAGDSAPRAVFPSLSSGS